MVFPGVIVILTSGIGVFAESLSTTEIDTVPLVDSKGLSLQETKKWKRGITRIVQAIIRYGLIIDLLKESYSTMLF
jgi:hypothetical protein